MYICVYAFIVWRYTNPTILVFGLIRKVIADWDTENRRKGQEEEKKTLNYFFLSLTIRQLFISYFFFVIYSYYYIVDIRNVQICSDAMAEH